MRKILPLILAFSMLLCACGTEKTQSYSPDAPPEAVVDVPLASADELARIVMTSVGIELDSMLSANESYGEEVMPSYIENYYGISPDWWSDCAVYRSEAADKAYEISIFRLTEQADISEVFNSLEMYRHSRQGDFFGYNPEQADMVDRAIVSLGSDGMSVALLICDDPNAAESAFFSAQGMELPEVEPTAEPVEEEKNEPLYHSEYGELPVYWIPYTDPETDDMTLWDNTEFVAAVKAGDEYYLSPDEKVLFKIVVGVLLDIIDEGMSDLEKERAVYEWITSKVEYDRRHYEVPNAAPRESYEPMGAIASRKAVCLGYAEAFRLFMDILDIECITVVGAAYNSMENHSWNMVKIDGEWYCVDTTWEAGTAPEYWNYFNVSSDYMAATSHQWDYEAYPMAQPEKIGTNN